MLRSGYLVLAVCLVCLSFGLGWIIQYHRKPEVNKPESKASPSVPLSQPLAEVPETETPQKSESESEAGVDKDGPPDLGSGEFYVYAIFPLEDRPELSILIVRSKERRANGDFLWLKCVGLTESLKKFMDDGTLERLPESESGPPTRV